MRKRTNPSLHLGNSWEVKPWMYIHIPTHATHRRREKARRRLKKLFSFREKKIFFFYQFRLVPANRKKESVGKRKKKIKGQSRSTFYYTPWHQQEFDIKTWRDRRREPNPIFPTAVSCWPHLHTSNFAVDWPSCDFIGNLTHTPTSPFVWQKNKTTFVPSLFSEVAVQYNNYTILFCCSETPVQVHPVTVCWLLGLEAYSPQRAVIFI